MKKFLSMALALVMTLSLCTFVVTPEASADFTDADQLSSKYAVQAADVIQEIEVMDGYDDGTFRPTAGLTRQAAAKIICNMILGPTTARALPTNANPFPDVLAGNQFSGYISYCAQQGIISGYADGTFRGGDPLSGYAYLKMLLGALGYDAQKEGFVGDNWKVNVAKIALGIGLNEGIEDDLDGTTQVTREAAAIYAFNTLQADMVEYESTNTLEINGVKVSMGGGNAVPQTWNTSSTSNDNINDRRSDGQNQRPIVQFAERYFDKLRREPAQWDTYTPDDFGRPSIRWFWKGVEIGTYSRDPEAVFIGGVKVNAIYEALGMTSGNSTAHLYVNSSIPNNERLNVARSNDKDLDDASNLLMNAQGNSSDVYGDGNHRVDRIGDGTIIECYRNDANNHVDVCVISVYGGKVSSVKGATAKKDAYVTIDYAPDTDSIHRPNTINLAGNNEFETEEFDEDDVVAYTYSDSAQEIKSMYLMTSESGVLQSRVNTKSLTLGDVTYNYGKEYTFDDISGNENGLSNKSSYVVYLDENDYVLWVEEDEFAVDQYVLIERISIETTSLLNGKTTTASVIGPMETATDVNDIASSVALQNAYQQAKTSLGTSTWDARARLRYSNGTVRTVTLDDSKNYRTDSGDDLNKLSANYNVTTNPASVTETPPYTAANPNPLTGVSYRGLTGNGKGNWIAWPFTAGHIVRVSSTSSGYKLHALRTDDSQVIVANDIRLSNKKLAYRSGADITYASGTKTLYCDSETHFAIDDTVNGTYRTYVGIKNAPDVNTLAGNSATAYIYHRDGVAKLVFITDTGNVSSSSSDIVFLAANSTSKRISSDIDDYYTVTAVEKNVVKTLMVRWDAAISMGAITYNPATDDNETHCVILNNVTYDSNDLITNGTFTGGLTVGQVQGIRRVNSEEVRLNTHYSNSSLHDLAENVRVYFVDGDNIDQIEVDEIVNDTLDMVYYVEDDGELTYVFIVDYDGDAVITDTTTLYADGELEQHNNQSFTFHYVNNNAPATVVAALKGWLYAHGLLTDLSKDGTVANIDNGYTITIEGVPYTVNYARDAKNVVTCTSSTMSPNVTSVFESSKQYHAYSVNPPVAPSTTPTLGDVNAAGNIFIAGTTATFTITPVSGAITSASVTVTDSDGSRTTNAVSVTGSSTNEFTVSFQVPNSNFTLAFNAA